MNLEFSVKETVIRHSGVIDEIQYEFEEITTENVSFGITTKKEKRSRTYDLHITRTRYNQLTQHIPNALSFDDFILVLRPFMMGFYHHNELERAFQILDRNSSGSIDTNELAKFVPIINEYATINTLKNHIRKLNVNIDGHLNYNEFRSLILRGIGRELLCTHA
ncbi:unnamed protein product [Rotaria sordida]|uniref:EF-hand domain-containing protein n=1 Tax=Rotaria sordida TaxID=392033 RepID=A0A819LJ67_9BILA|nr:unnamed protein product [Rotaria sordida]CAF0811283.1 unnamed protein product [Rotaria sordida]CAF3962534.1 unnamed protein product [Rotaria sordida]